MLLFDSRTLGLVWINKIKFIVNDQSSLSFKFALIILFNLTRLIYRMLYTYIYSYDHIEFFIRIRIITILISLVNELMIFYNNMAI